MNKKRTIGTVDGISLHGNKLEVVCGNEKQEYELKETTEQELISLQINGVPMFKLKKRDKMYYTVIPKQLRLITPSMLEKHKCGGDSKVCEKFSAASDGDGGCAKIRDLMPRAYIEKKYSIEKAVKASKRIEKYNHILLGYETCNTNSDVFVVLVCSKFVEYKRKPIKKNVDDVKLALAENCYGPIANWEELFYLMRINRSQYVK